MATMTSKTERAAVVSQAEWGAARKELLRKEKEFTKLRDELSRERRALPWETVEKKYVFEGPNGKQTLADLFGKRSQLVVYHFMFGPGWKEGCPSCSFLADSFDGAVIHLAQRDVTFVAISRATSGILSELLGTFLLVLVAVGGGMVNARFGGSAVPCRGPGGGAGLDGGGHHPVHGRGQWRPSQPGGQSGLRGPRGNFPWKRVPAYLAAQALGAILATLLLWAVLGKQGTAGLTLPGRGISPATAMVWELILTAGLVSTVLGTASGAQQLGPFAAIGVGSYIALAGLWGSPVERGIHEPGPIAGSGPGAQRLDRLVGLSARSVAGGGRGHRYRSSAAGTRRRYGWHGRRSGHPGHSVGARPHSPARARPPRPTPTAPASPTGPASPMGPASPDGPGSAGEPPPKR